MSVVARVILVLAATLIPPPTALVAGETRSYASADALRHFAQGRLLEEQGRGSAALGEYYRALILDPESVEIAIHASDLSARMGDHRRALELADRALGLAPAEPRALWLRGTALFNLERPEEAIEPLTAAARGDSGRVEYLQSLARAAEHLGRLDLVAWSYRRAVQVDPFDGEMWFQLAAAEARLGRFGPADSAMARAMEFNPLRPGAQFLDGWIQESLGHRADAIALYQRHIAVHPSDVTTRQRLMMMLLEEGRYEEAYEQAEVVAREKPGDLDALEVKAHVALGAKREAEARETLDLIEQYGFDEPEIFARLVTVLARNERDQDVKRLFERWKIRNPNDYRGPLAAARTAAVRGEPDLAIDFAAMAVEAAPDSLPPRIVLAQAYQIEKRWSEAGGAWRDVLRLTPGHTPSGFNLAYCLEQAGDVPGAEAVVRRILVREPDNADALNFLGYLLADHNLKLEEAESMILRAVEMEPDNGAFIDSLGWVYYRLGRLTEARGQLERAVRLTGGDPVVHEHLGDVYKDLNLKDLAREQYRLSLSRDAGTERVQRKLEEAR